MKLAFSSLACPDRSWREVIRLAADLGFDGVEWRLVDGAVVDGSFAPKLADEIGRVTSEHGLGMPALDSSIELARPPGDERDRTVHEVAALLRTARRFGAEHLRVFVGPYPESVPTSTAREWMFETLSRLNPVAREQGVLLAVELHSIDPGFGVRQDGTTCSEFLREVLASDGALSHCGIQWDVANSVAEGEDPARTWENVHRRLTYVQIKDIARGTDGRWSNMAMGTGSIPTARILEWLRADGFSGWLSFEWEKWWQPELDDAEIALPQFIRHVRPLLSGF